MDIVADSLPFSILGCQNCNYIVHQGISKRFPKNECVLISFPQLQFCAEATHVACEEKKHVPGHFFGVENLLCWIGFLVARAEAIQTIDQAMSNMRVFGRRQTGSRGNVPKIGAKIWLLIEHKWFSNNGWIFQMFFHLRFLCLVLEFHPEWWVLNIHAHSG